MSTLNFDWEDQLKWVKCAWDHNFLWPRGKLSIIAVDRNFFFSRKDTVEGLDGRGHFQGAELDPNGEIIFVLKWHLVD